MKRLASLVLLALCCQAGHGQAGGTEAETPIAESGYSVSVTSRGQYKVVGAAIISNPHEDKFAYRPMVRLTARAADGSVIATRELNITGIPPKGRIAICGSLSAEERPAKVEIRPLPMRYEPTAFRPSEFIPFELIGMRARDAGYGYLRFTGEIKNPYPGETGAWLTLLYRDAGGQLLGCHAHYLHTIPAGEPTPFEFSINADDVPAQFKNLERLVFSHNDYQSSWVKLLRR